MTSNNNTTINLQTLIGVGEDEIKKELDSVKYYARLYDFNYREILDVYSEDFVPACMYANIDWDTMHNLFVAIMEFLRSSRATDNIAKETMQELSHTIANNEEENPSKYLESSRYKIPNLEKHINYIYQNGKYYDKTGFYREFAHHIHYLYKDKTEGAKNKYVTKRKNAENEIFYGRRKKNFFDYIFDKLGRAGDKLFEDGVSNGIKFLNMKNTQRKEKKSRYEYVIYEDEIMPLFERFKAPELLNFEMDLNPYKNILAPFGQDYAEYYEPKAIRRTVDVQTIPQDNLTNRPNYTILPQPEQAPPAQTTVITEIRQPVFQPNLKDELVTIFDEFALNHGYIQS